MNKPRSGQRVAMQIGFSVMENKEFDIESLGKPTLPSPIKRAAEFQHIIGDQERFLYKPSLSTFRRCKESGEEPLSFEIAGPRDKIYYAPARTKAAIVTCGGLCPGINAVIRALVMELWYVYGVKNIVGIPYGYKGLASGSTYDFVELNPDKVIDIHEQGGTILGSSRGTPPPEEIVDVLERYNINILFTIGGDGTMRGATELSQIAKSRGLKIGIIGIPKTIDNDIPYVRQSFGFESAVAVACGAVRAAHEEARGAERGIGLVKIMGRHSGYIAANTALATGHANFCLIPEVPFGLVEEGGLLPVLEERLDKSDHALIIVAEGAGQYFFQDKGLGKDKSGNPKLGDIGVFLRDRIKAYFKKAEKPVSLKYIDPSYIIRSQAANPADRLFCATLAQNAAHAAMAGKTAMLIGYWHGVMTHVPLSALQGKSQNVRPDGAVWFNVLEMTGQPAQFGQPPVE